MTPIPPNFAISMAILDSVTVSIAEEIMGILRFKLFDNFVSVIVSDGRISEYFGVSKTSSYVRASLIGSMSLYI